MKQFIKKTKTGAIIEAENGRIFMDGKVIGAVQKPQTAALKAALNKVGMVAYSPIKGSNNKIGFTEAECALIRSTMPKLGVCKGNREYDRIDKDFIPADVSFNMPDDSSLSSATDGQLDIYRD